MILVDSDILVLDLRYQADPRYADNKSVLQRLQSEALPVGITCQALLEVVGILSYNTGRAQISRLPQYLTAHYGLNVFPDPAQLAE